MMVRYIVNDVDQAIRFYCDYLDFKEVMHPAPAFAIVARDDLQLALSAPGGPGGGGPAMPDGTLPSPGGWNRFVIEVGDLKEVVDRLRGNGVTFRSDLIEGVAGNQVIVEDPSGNPVEIRHTT